MQRPVHWSELKHILRSPAHYRYAIDHPEPPSPQMRVGAIAHAVVLGGIDRFRIWTGKVRRGKLWDAFVAETHNGIEIINKSEADAAERICDAVYANPDAATAIRAAARERPVTWVVGGRICQGTPDLVTIGAVAELKVTADASPLKFPWHARKQKWHAQLAWYAHGLGDDKMRQTIIAVEARPPHVVQLYDLTPRTIEEGHRTWRAAIERLQVHEDCDRWPGYSEIAYPFDVPDDGELALTLDGEEVVL